MRALLVQIPPFRDTDAIWFGLLGIALLLIGGVLVRFAGRRRR